MDKSFETQPEHVTDSEVYYRGAASAVCLIRPFVWLILSLILAIMIVRLLRASEGSIQAAVQKGVDSVPTAGPGAKAEARSAVKETIDWTVPILGWAIAIQGMFFLLRRVWRWLSIRYTLTNDRIEIEEGILSKHIENIELWRVKELDFLRSLIEWFFGIGRLRIGFLDQGNRVLIIGPLAGGREVYEKVKQARLRAGRKAGAQAVGIA